MSIEPKDSSYFHRVEEAVRLLATSTDSPRNKVEIAFTSYLIPLFPLKPADAIDKKLCDALALATQYPAVIKDEGTIHATMRRVRYGTLQKIMNLIFEAYLEMRPNYYDSIHDRTAKA